MKTTTVFILYMSELIFNGESKHIWNVKNNHSKGPLRSDLENELAEQMALKFIIKNFLQNRNLLSIAPDDESSNNDEENKTDSSFDGVNMEVNTESEEPKRNMKLYIIKVKNNPKYNFVAKRAFSAEHFLRSRDKLPNGLKNIKVHHFTEFPRQTKAYSKEYYGNNKQHWYDQTPNRNVRRPWNDFDRPQNEVKKPSNKFRIPNDVIKKPWNKDETPDIGIKIPNNIIRSPQNGMKAVNKPNNEIQANNAIKNLIYLNKDPIDAIVKQNNEIKQTIIEFKERKPPIDPNSPIKPSEPKIIQLNIEKQTEKAGEVKIKDENSENGVTKATLLHLTVHLDVDLDLNDDSSSEAGQQAVTDPVPSPNLLNLTEPLDGDLDSNDESSSEADQNAVTDPVPSPIVINLDAIPPGSFPESIPAGINPAQLVPNLISVRRVDSPGHLISRVL